MLGNVGAGPAPKPVTEEDFLINELISADRRTRFDRLVAKILLHILRKLNVPDGGENDG